MLRIFILWITISGVVFSPYISAESVNNNGRIVGGKLTDISNHPHQISMVHKSCTTCSFKHRCGGSIISKTIVITAAHCVNTITDPKSVHVVAGANERNGHGVIVPVEKIIVHEDYQKNVAFENDIAILVLAIELPLNNYDIKAIKLTDTKPLQNEVAYITGWGTTTEGGNPSDFLLEVAVPIISNEVCEYRYGSGRINESMLCAGTNKGGKDACQGDSGGPLVVKGVLAGVVSWGNGCARPEYPGVYANVSHLRPWIDNVIKENS